MQEKNIFSDFGSWATTAKKRNPNTALDEIRMVVLGLLIIATVYVLGTGGYYHYLIFNTATQNEGVALIVAGLFFIGGEFAKFKLGELALWGLISKDFIRTWRRFTIYGLICAFVGFVYWWSYDITANNAPTLNALVNKSKGNATVDSSQLVSLQANLASIQSQVEGAESEAKRGLSIKWKGTTIGEGRDIAKGAIKSKNSLLDQQSDITAAMLKEQKRLQGFKDAQLDGAAVTMGHYGGYAEAAQAILMLLNVLLMFELAVINAKPQSQAPHSIGNVQHGRIVNDGSQPVATSERRQIGFFANAESLPKETVVATKVVDTGKKVVDTVSTAKNVVSTNLVSTRTPNQLLGDLNLYQKRIMEQEVAKGQASEQNQSSFKRIFEALAKAGYNPIWNGVKYVFDKEVANG
jgi:hypothetical protein